MSLIPEDIMETIQMIQMEHLDVRTVTMGISLRSCPHPRLKRLQERIRERILLRSENLVATVEAVQRKFGVPIINTRISVTPISVTAEALEDLSPEAMVSIAETLDEVAKEVGVDFLGGFSALVHKGITPGDAALIEAIPSALAQTQRVCASLNVATTRSGINMDAVVAAAHAISATARATQDQDSVGCAKLVVFANSVEDNPFMAGAYHGFGESDCTINVGVSGPGVVRHQVEQLPDADLRELANAIKRTAFKVSRMGELVGREVSQQLGVDFGIIDVSLAPSPAIGDSVANILEAMGLESIGAHGTTAALAMLNDAVKKGGAMASSHVGGLSGAFIPVSEDQGMVEAISKGALTFDKLEAMTSVCSVGLDMIAIPGDTSPEVIAGMIADEAAIGMINGKTTAVRLIPVAGKKVGDEVTFGGLLGRAVVIAVNPYSPARFVGRGGRIPAPLQGLSN